jgi:cell division protein FtsN
VAVRSAIPDAPAGGEVVAKAATSPRAAQVEAHPVASANAEELMGPQEPTVLEAARSRGEGSADGRIALASVPSRSGQPSEEKTRSTVAGASVTRASVTATRAGATEMTSAAARTKASVARHSDEPVYTVQLGAFKARENAEELVTRLHGKPTRILREGGLYRVMSGSFASKRDAAVHEASLKRAGYTTYVRTAAF